MARDPPQLGAGGQGQSVRTGRRPPRSGAPCRRRQVAAACRHVRSSPCRRGALDCCGQGNQPGGLASGDRSCPDRCHVPAAGEMAGRSWMRQSVDVGDGRSLSVQVGRVGVVPLGFTAGERHSRDRARDHGVCHVVTSRGSTRASDSPAFVSEQVRGHDDRVPACGDRQVPDPVRGRLLLTCRRGPQPLCRRAWIPSRLGFRAVGDGSQQFAANRAGARPDEVPIGREGPPAPRVG